MHDFLQIAGKTFLVIGVANKKSVAWHVADQLRSAGARVIYSVHSETRRESVRKLLPNASIHVCDLESEEQIAAMRDRVAEELGEEKLAGLLHSVAFADYSQGIKPFHETPKAAFLRSMDVSCFSLVALAGAFQKLLASDASVVTVSISTTRMASENYGFMAPIKAALDSSLAFLTKSFSRFSQVRFNAVAPSLLKTASSAGIPGYVDAFLYAEQAIPRKQALETVEAASVATFLLSPRSSGIASQSIVVDAGMSTNYFDADLIRRSIGNKSL